MKTAFSRMPVAPDAMGRERAGVPPLPAFQADMASYNDQLIRQTRVYHVQLSMMADSKANMLLTISSVLATLSAAHLGDVAYRWPAMVLMAGCALSVFFAALTSMPKFFRHNKGDARADPHMPGFNVLFFADFVNLNYGEFLRTMEETMSSASTAYEAQLREIYLLGSFLERSKYRWLRLGYLSFLCGLGSSVALWIALAL